MRTLTVLGRLHRVLCGRGGFASASSAAAHSAVWGYGRELDAESAAAAGLVERLPPGTAPWEIDWQRTIPVIRAKLRRGGRNGATLARKLGLVPAYIEGDGCDGHNAYFRASNRDVRDRVGNSTNHIFIGCLPHDLCPLAHSRFFFNSIFDVDVEELGMYRVFATKRYVDPVHHNTKIQSVMFKRWRPNMTIRIEVPVFIEHARTAAGVRRGGVLLPGEDRLQCFWDGDHNIPGYISVDAARLNIGHVASMKSTYIPKGLRPARPHLNPPFCSIVGSKGTDADEEGKEVEQ